MRSRKIVFIAFIAVLLSIMLFGLCACGASDGDEVSAAADNTEPIQESSAVSEQTDDKDDYVAFPAELENGNLTVESLFTSDLTNPDTDDSYVENLASLQVSNSGESYITTASIQLTTVDGIELNFEIYDLPAGASVLIFDTANTAIDNLECLKVSGTASYDNEAGIPADIQISPDDSGTSFIVTNVGDEMLSNITVIYRTMMDQIYFGGVSYNQSVEVLDSGDSVIIDAPECWLGVPDVVFVSTETEK